ncbi:DNA adenine methylase, partial [Clostridium butyricum]
MRFIGSKTLLLDQIKQVIDERAPEAKSFCDIFSGTAAVARYFKQWYQVSSNDLLYFSYVLQRATVENDTMPEFTLLNEVLGIEDPVV